MNKQTQEISVMPTEEVAKSLQAVVLSVTGNEGLQGFQRAYMMAEGIRKLKEILTPAYMAPIMELQGSKLGFRTDKDLKKGPNGGYIKGDGYPMEVVKDCLIEATLNGLEITGNQFNIIAGNCYPTKEGCGAKLNKFPGLKQKIIISLPRVNSDKTSAAVDALIKWTLNGESNEETIQIPIKMDAYTSLDAVNGKATRKARAWLISHITGTEVTDGEVEDVLHTVVDSKTKSKDKQQTEEEIDAQRWLALFKESSSSEELSFFEGKFPDNLKTDFDKRMNELKSSSKK